MRTTNKLRIANGRALLTLYGGRKAGLSPKVLDSALVAEAIADLLHYASSKGFDPESIYRKCLERQELEAIESCPKCGTPVTRGGAVVDFGQGEESGRIFHYCSEGCKERH